VHELRDGGVERCEFWVDDFPEQELIELVLHDEDIHCENAVTRLVGLASRFVLSEARSTKVGAYLTAHTLTGLHVATGALDGFVARLSALATVTWFRAASRASLVRARPRAGIRAFAVATVAAFVNIFLRHVPTTSAVTAVEAAFRGTGTARACAVATTNMTANQLLFAIPCTTLVFEPLVASTTPTTRPWTLVPTVQFKCAALWADKVGNFFALDVVCVTARQRNRRDPRGTRVLAPSFTVPADVVATVATVGFQVTKLAALGDDH
jgi:hypothetical protein